MKCDKRKPNPFRKVWLNYEWILRAVIQWLLLIFSLLNES